MYIIIYIYSFDLGVFTKVLKQDSWRILARYKVSFFSTNSKYITDEYMLCGFITTRLNVRSQTFPISVLTLNSTVSIK